MRQSHKEGLQRKVAERTADLRSKQQQLAAIEQVCVYCAPMQCHNHLSVSAAILVFA